MTLIGRHAQQAALAGVKPLTVCLQAPGGRAAAAGGVREGAERPERSCEGARHC